MESKSFYYGMDASSSEGSERGAQDSDSDEAEGSEAGPEEEYGSEADAVFEGSGVNPLSPSLPIPTAAMHSTASMGTAASSESILTGEFGPLVQPMKTAGAGGVQPSPSPAGLHGRSRLGQAGSGGAGAVAKPAVSEVTAAGPVKLQGSRVSVGVVMGVVEAVGWAGVPLNRWEG